MQLGDETGYLVWEVVIGSQEVKIDAGTAQVLDKADVGGEETDGESQHEGGAGGENRGQLGKTALQTPETSGANLYQSRTFDDQYPAMELIDLVLKISYLGLAGTLFAETGLLVGFVLPGDSLLVTVGLLAAAHKLGLIVALVALLLGSWLGHQVGYVWGQRLGPGLKDRVRPEHLARTQAFFRRYGPMAVVLAPLVPVVRTLMPFVSGGLAMPWPRFALLSLVGTLIWTQGITLLGYWIGNAIPGLEKYLLLVVAGVVALSLLPGWLHLWRARQVGAED